MKDKGDNTIAKPLIKGETLLGVELENGYLFHRGDGIVRFRTYNEHEDHIEASKFTEPPAAPQQRGF